MFICNLYTFICLPSISLRPGRATRTSAGTSAQYVYIYIYIIALSLSLSIYIYIYIDTYIYKQTMHVYK